MARREQYRRTIGVEESVTLMPVRPSSEQNSESLSHDGETPITTSSVAISGDAGLTAPGDSSPEETRREVESDDGGDDTGDDDDVMEARVARGSKSPKDPTRKEKEEHELTHMPFRSWCEDCVKSRARNAHHRKKLAPDPLEEVKVAREHMDYFFMSSEYESASSKPLFVMAAEKSGARYARAAGKKGLGVADEMDWLIQDIGNTLKSWGHAGGAGGHLILKSDGEPALMAVKNAVMQYHRGFAYRSTQPNARRQRKAS